jgi:hypothetical protein
MPTNQDKGERKQLLLVVDNLLEEIVIPVIQAAARGEDATELAAEGTKRMTDFILEDRKSQAKALLERVEREVIGKDDNVGVDPDWPWSKSAHADQLRAKQRTALRTIQGEIE